MKLIETGDGSHTIYREDLDETYHSRHGAIMESVHVFIKNGLRHLISSRPLSTIDVFELGLGTGLNATLSCLEAIKFRKIIRYLTLEPYPVKTVLLEALNYKDLIPYPGSGEILQKIHKGPWESSFDINTYFSIIKKKERFEEYTAPKDHFHLIYYDAFAPSKQPDIWHLNLIRQSLDMLLPGGMLVTYCSQGQFKRDLSTAGFKVATIPGPPGKKEMVRATKPG